MSTNFAGYLLKFAYGETEAVFPHKYLAQKPKLKPNQRMEAEAYRDAAANLHRVTLDNHKSRMEFTTVSGVTLEQKIEMETAMAAGLINTTQRKYHLEFWNDDVGVNDYTEGDFYLVDPEYSPIKITDETIVYDAVKYVFVEY